MPSFPKPKFEFVVDLPAEIKRLRAHKAKRAIPKREKGKLLAATWNVANLGAQERGNEHLQLIAEMVSWFDIVAIQECRENFADMANIHERLSKNYRVLYSDASGNDERMVFVYDGLKLKLLDEIGEISFPPSQQVKIKLPDGTSGFTGFDRTPYLAGFAAGGTSFTFVNAHLYFGSEVQASIQRRALETFAIAKWADARSRSKFTQTRELVVMGDMNMPKSLPGDPIFDALTRLGLEVPDHSSQIASTIASDANYDQIAFLPGTTKNCFTGLKGVFDYDTVIFPGLWQGGANAKNFKAFLRYFISDHRPMWVQLSF